ncbi:MAG: choice-of-anchor Q domain-containing protein [Panacagrimonas sp.]
MKPRAVPLTALRLRRNLFALAAAGAFFLPVPEALARNIRVTGGCTLADAITAANTDRRTGGCRPGSGPDTLILPRGSILTLSAVNSNSEDYGPTGLPVISSDITLRGSGSSIVRSPGAANFRLLAVSFAGTLNVQRTTLSGGLLTLTDSPFGGAGILNRGSLSLSQSTVSGHSSEASGGGIANYGTLNLGRSTVSDNRSEGRGGGIANQDGTLSLGNSTVSGNSSRGAGGGIYNAYSLSLRNSTVSGNRSRDNGGGIAVQDAGLTMRGSTVSDNTSRLAGGGIHAVYGALLLSDSLISGNTSTNGNGGGIRNDSGGSLSLLDTLVSANRSGRTGGGIASDGILNLTRSTVSGNTSDEAGGGIRSSGTLRLTASTVSGNRAATGGGIQVDTYSYYNGSSTLSNSTVSGNTAASGGGGGLLTIGGRTLISQSTITGNLAADTRGGGVASAENPGNRTLTKFFSSIVAGNTGTDIHLLTGPIGRFLSQGDNLIGDGRGAAAFSAIGDRTGVIDPGLAPLADNGGATLTHALLATSPAIDAVTRVGACRRLNTDQRGFVRPVDGDLDGTAGCDIGAFEWGAVSPAP